LALRQSLRGARLLISLRAGSLLDPFGEAFIVDTFPLNVLSMRFLDKVPVLALNKVLLADVFHLLSTDLRANL